MINAESLATMKRGVYLVNCARGGLVDQDALLAALESGQVAGAGLDVTDPEPLPQGHALLSHPNVIVTPHVASATVAGSAAAVFARHRQRTQRAGRHGRRRSSPGRRHAQSSRRGAHFRSNFARTGRWTLCERNGTRDATRSACGWPTPRRSPPRRRHGSGTTTCASTTSTASTTTSRPSRWPRPSSSAVAPPSAVCRGTSPASSARCSTAASKASSCRWSTRRPRPRPLSAPVATCRWVPAASVPWSPACAGPITTNGPPTASPSSR